MARDLAGKRRTLLAVRDNDVAAVDEHADLGEVVVARLAFLGQEDLLDAELDEERLHRTGRSAPPHAVTKNDAHLGVGKEFVVDKLADAHLPHRGVGKGDADGLDAVLDGDFESEDDWRGEHVRVSEEELLDLGEVPGTRTLGELPLVGRPGPFRLVDLDPELLRRERIAEEALRDGTRECAGCKPFARRRRLAEVLEHARRLEVVLRDKERVRTVRREVVLRSA